MGYACPVCGDPQADAEHLANHLAFTAMLGDGDHETWLDEHAPDWDETDADALSDIVVEHAEEKEFPQVFEDTTGHDHEHGRDPDHERSGALFDDEPQLAADARERAQRDRQLDDQAERILEDAREMTERMLEDADEAETE